MSWTGKHNLYKISGELWSKVDITWFQYIILFNKTKQTCVVYAILQCKKTDILERNRTLVVVEPEPNRTLVVTEPEQNRTRTMGVVSHL